MKRCWAMVCLAAAVVAVRAQTPGGAPGGAAANGYIQFNFDNADLRMLAQLVGGVTGRRLVVGDKVTGRVTVVSPGRVPLGDVYPLFLSILESAGYTVIEQGGATFVVPLPERAGLIAPAAAAGDGGGGLVTRIFRLEHISALEFARMIEPLVRGGKAGGLAAFGPTNHLIVTDTEPGLRRIEAILAELDRPGSARVVEVVPLRYAAAEDVADQVARALLGAESAGSRVSRHMQQVAEGGAALPGQALVVPAAQANSLVLVGAPVQLAEMKRIIGMLDVEPAAGHGRLSAVFLKYLSAEDAAKSLNALLAKTVGKDQQQRIAIEPSPQNNALLVDAAPRDFEWVRDLIGTLDQMPHQVMVEVLIAEVALGKDLKLGVEWSTIESPKAGATTVLGRSRPGETDVLMDAITKGVFPQGVTIGVARGLDAAGNPRVPFLVTALQQQRDVRILSNVPLWAQNNREASVSIVDNIPILRSTIQGGSGTARDVIQNIDRMDVGIKLKITPHVNPDREITLQLNPSIEAIIDDGPADMQFAPTIAKREVSTTVTVADRATVVLSGLMREDRIKGVSKVPLLGDIPLLGALFRYHTTKNQRSNLLIFVTPHLVTSPEAAAQLRAQMETRTGIPGPAAATNTPAAPPAAAP